MEHFGKKPNKIIIPNALKPVLIDYLNAKMFSLDGIKDDDSLDSLVLLGLKVSFEDIEYIEVK